MQIEYWRSHFTAEALTQCDKMQGFPPGTTLKFLCALEKKVNRPDLQAKA